MGTPVVQEPREASNVPGGVKETDEDFFPKLDSRRSGEVVTGKKRSNKEVIQNIILKVKLEEEKDKTKGKNKNRTTYGV